MVCSALTWGLQRSECKVSHKEGCRPTQACPVHSPRVSNVKQTCESHSSVNAPPLVRHHTPMEPVYFQNHRPLSNSNWHIPSSSVSQRKILLLPALLHPQLSLEETQEEKSAVSVKRSIVCKCTGTGAWAWKHTQVYVKWRQKEARGHIETKDQQSGSKYGNVKEMDQEGVNWQERKRKCLEDTSSEYTWEN